MRSAIVKLTVMSVASLSAAACGDTASLSVEAVSGTQPRLVSPDESLIPTIEVALAVGWPDGATPEVAEGLTVSLYASGLDHPRWLYTLPTGSRGNRKPARCGRL